MDTLKQLLELAPDCVRISTEHGFWEEGDKRNKGEMIALICSELYESLEGHRKNKRANSKQALYNTNLGGDWNANFKEYIKDSVEDEICDAVIRILDYTYGWKIPVLDFTEFTGQTRDNYGDDLLRLNKLILDAYDGWEIGHNWGYLLSAIIKFCEWYNIDIVAHCKWKMKYNESRPAKHGKAY